MNWANWYWLIITGLWFVSFLVVETWAIATGNRQYTFSYSLWQLRDKWEWFLPVLVGFFGWFLSHIAFGNKEKKTHNKDDEIS